MDTKSAAPSAGENKLAVIENFRIAVDYHMIEHYGFLGLGKSSSYG